MLRRRNLVALLVAASVVGGMVPAAAPPAASGVAALPLIATPVPLNPDDPGQIDVGRLRYMGGVVLRSTDESFGGLSGLRAGASGRLLAISDTGNWVTFVAIERRERLVGVTGGTIAPLLDERGKPPYDKDAGDAEALEWNAATGTALVSFEQDHRIATYRGIDPAKPASLATSAVKVERLAAVSAWSSNAGGEALASLSDGTRIVIEEGEDTAAALSITPAGVRQFVYAPPRGFRPTDAAELAPGRLLVLNRRFTPREGVSAVIEVVDVREGMPATEVARLAPPLSVDNMEGIAVRRDGTRTFIYLVSDDNFLGLQRTLLLKFELLAATSPRIAAPPPR